MTSFDENESASGADLDWRSRALDRSLQSARTRAIDQFESLMKAAFELLGEEGSEFTVQDVASRSKTSLRAFYLYFAGKDDLLLAMYEESVRWMVDTQHAANALVSDPVERVRTFFEVLWDRFLQSPAPMSRALAVFYNRLSETRPTDLVRVHAPEYEYLVALLAECRASGRVTIEASDEDIASLMLNSLFAIVRSSVLEVHFGGRSVDSAPGWMFLMACLRPL